MARIRACIAASLTLALLFVCLDPAVAATSADATRHAKASESARVKAAKAQALAKQLKGETATLDKRVASLQSQADALDPQIGVAADRASALHEQVAQMRAQIASATTEIAVTQAEVSREQALLAARVTAVYKQGKWFYLELLLSSSGVRDLVVRTEFVARVLEANGIVAMTLSAESSKLERQKSELDRTLADLTVKRREADAVESQLRGLRGVRQAKVDAQRSVLDQKSSLLSETRSNARRLLAIAEAEAAESARIRAELARAKHGSGAYHGSMAWPVPGFHTITSPFGYRMHPILRRRIFHAGIDISGSGIYGQAIVAAGSGTVIAAGPRGGYGNVVMIDHGNGVVTVYGHQRNGGIRVSVGDRVSKSQRIGTVGSTGLSTGPHLHFEVRVNGTAVNPMNYL